MSTGKESGSTSWVQTIDLNGINTPYLQVSGATYGPASYFEFPGSNEVGVPTSISSVCYRNSGTDMDIRIYDVTNTQVICEKVNITDLVETINDLGTISNIPTTAAIFAVEMLATGPGGKARCASVTIRY